MFWLCLKWVVNPNIKLSSFIIQSLTLMTPIKKLNKKKHVFESAIEINAYSLEGCETFSQTWVMDDTHTVYNINKSWQFVLESYSYIYCVNVHFPTF